MKYVMCVEQIWKRTPDGFNLVATYEDGRSSELVEVRHHETGWWSRDLHAERRWCGPFKRALPAVRAQRCWWEPFRKLCREVNAARLDA